jgi:CheY-like chemotaxis protein
MVMSTDERVVAGAKARREPGTPLRVLIVDDAASPRLFLLGVLESCAEFAVAGEAGDGAIAIEKAEALQPDVILLDLSMPVTDGSSAFAGLVRVAPRAHVIVLSGSDKKEAAVLVAAGATAFIPKGLAPFELLDRIGSSLGLSVTLQRTQRGPANAADVHAQPLALICDDDPTTRRLVAQIISNCHLTLVAATDGVPHMLSVVELTKPDLLVLDLWLEGITGTSALPDIRKASPNTRVVVYSSLDEWEEKALAAGATSFILKPDFVALEAEIRRLFPAPRP